MKKINEIQGFSKLTKEQKQHLVAELFDDSQEMFEELQSYGHPDADVQKKFDEFSENTITNFYMPYGIAPNVKLNDRMYMVPMVIEESSVVAAASKSAKFWLERGGFRAEVVSTRKVGQVHFVYRGDKQKLFSHFDELKQLLFSETEHITHNMQKRGGGIASIELVDKTDVEDNFYQIKGEFETVDSMGANFINSCLEEFATITQDWFHSSGHFTTEESEVQVIMSILSNFTPDCLVKCWVECPIDDLGVIEGMQPREFAQKFANAVRVAQIDPYRATTHNKGIYNGIDSVVLATGNDFRAVEACGHAYASKDGHYTSLTDVSIDNDTFKFTLTVPMALGVVGGLTSLHPLVKRSLQLLGSPSASELMMISTTIGLANNFGAVKSLTTTGIQKGHMKMHLLNILNHFDATEDEREKAVEYFKYEKVGFSTVRVFIERVRSEEFSEMMKDVQAQG